MTHDELLAHCLSLPGAWPDQPWEDDVVAKVHTKIFVFIGSDGSIGRSEVRQQSRGGRRVAAAVPRRTPR